MLKKRIKKSVEIPEGLDANLEDRTLKISGPNGELSRKFDIRGIELEKAQNKIIIKSNSSRRKKRAAVGTVVSHVKNMVEGVTEGFSSKLKIVYSHFPISVSVRDRVVEIDNFIGEEKSRYADIVGDTEVEVKGEELEVRGSDKEDVGQTAANIEQTAQVRDRDPRVFQDGIYIVERP